MPKLDKKTVLKMPVDKVYGILNDFSILPVWNITVNEAEELEKDKWFFKSNVGDITNYVIEDVANERMTSRQEGDSPMQKIGYIFEPKGDDTEVTIWVEFELDDQESVLDIAADMFLKSLIVYVNHLLAGGDPKVIQEKIW